jgi:hypothetical protein
MTLPAPAKHHGKKLSGQHIDPLCVMSSFHQALEGGSQRRLSGEPELSPLIGVMATTFPQLCQWRQGPQDPGLLPSP